MEDQDQNVLRLFVAIFPPREVVEQMDKAIRTLRRRISADAVVWTPPDKIHLTLTFIGNWPAAQLASIELPLQQAIAASPSIFLRAAGLGCFPNMRRARIVWAGLHGATNAVERIKQESEGGFAQSGFAPETRPFKPHLTIGRVKRFDRRLAAAIASHRDIDLGSWPVRRIDLMRSRLSPSGAAYSVVRSFELPTTASGG